MARRYIASRPCPARRSRTMGNRNRQARQHCCHPDARYPGAQRRTGRRSADRLHLPPRRPQRASGHVPGVPRLYAGVQPFRRYRRLVASGRPGRSHLLIRPLSRRRFSRSTPPAHRSRTNPMRPMFTLALCSLGAGFACSPASAVSLNQLYDEALETDAQLQSARAGLTADSEQLPQARAKLLPQLSASVTASEQRTELGGGFPASTGNSNGYTVSLTQPLINVASWQGYQQGQIALTSAQAQFAAARQDLIVRLGQAYFDALSAQDSVAIVRSQKASIAEQLESAKRSFDVGQSTITDTNEAQAKYDQAISQEIAAQNDLEVKLAALEQIVGHPVTRVDGLARDRKST